MELRKKEYVIVALITLSVMGILIFLLMSVAATASSPQADLNNSEVGVIYSACSTCSVNIPYELYYTFAQYGYAAQNISLFFGDNITSRFIGNNLITALPSFVVPSSIDQNNQASTIMSALVYANIFTSGGNNFVLNTPFFADLSHTVTYYNILENRTETSVNIYNISSVYNITTATKFDPVAPIGILMLFNGTNMTYKNKPVITFVYSSSPYSAMQDFLFVSALKNFGNFTGLSTAFSQSFKITQAQSLGPQVYYSLQNATYSSPFFALDAYNSSSISSLNVSNLLVEYDQNALFAINYGYQNFMPFIDVGGKFISVSSMLQPILFNGMNVTQISAYESTNQTVSSLLNDSVSFIDAMLCTYTGASAAICSSQEVSGYISDISKSLLS